MKKEEIRIGNWIDVYGTNGNPKGFMRMQITSNHFKVFEENPEWFKPIELFDVITKMKIEWHSDINLVSSAHSKINDNSIIEFENKFLIMKSQTVFCEIKYVHELQNIYLDVAKGLLNISWI